MKVVFGIIIGVVLTLALTSGCVSTMKAAPADHEMHQTGIESQTSDY